MILPLLLLLPPRRFDLPDSNTNIEIFLFALLPKSVGFEIAVSSQVILLEKLLHFEAALWANWTGSCEKVYEIDVFPNKQSIVWFLIFGAFLSPFTRITRSTVYKYFINRVQHVGKKTWYYLNTSTEHSNQRRTMSKRKRTLKINVQIYNYYTSFFYRTSP